MTTQLTICGNTIRVVAEGDITQDEWVHLLDQHNLTGLGLDVLDYRVSDYDDSTIVTHEWIMRLTISDTTLRVGP